MQGFLILFAGKVLLGLLYVRKDELSGHFSFTSLPGMELAFCQQVASRRIVAQLVVKRDALHTEVVPLFHKLAMLFQKIKPLAVGHTAFFVELVKFHKDARIRGIERKGLFEQAHSLVGPSQLVVIGQSQVTQHGREITVQRGRTVPAVDRLFILSGSIPEVAQIVRCPGILGIQPHGILQDEDFLQTVGEAVVGRKGFGLAVESGSLLLLSLLMSKIAQRIHNHRISLSLFSGQEIQPAGGCLIESGCGIIQRIFQIGMYRIAHKEADSLLLLSSPADVAFFAVQQITFEAATHVEAVHGERFVNQCFSPVVFVHFAQEGSL